MTISKLDQSSSDKKEEGNQNKFLVSNFFIPYLTFDNLRLLLAF